jgi:hypothetical protein
MKRAIGRDAIARLPLRTAVPAALRLLMGAAAFALSLALATAVSAQDAQIYDPEPPKDAVFVRFVDRTGAGNMSVEMSGQKVEIGEEPASAYLLSKPGLKSIVVGNAKSDVMLDGGHYYTVVLDPKGLGSPILMNDKTSKNPAKSAVYLYNLSKLAAAELAAPKLKATVIKGVAPDGGDFREINAVTVSLAVMTDGKPVADFADVALERRASFSFFVFDTVEGPKARFFKNRFVTQ